MTTKSTYYRRALPDTCISFSSKKGREIFASALSHQYLKSFFPLIEQHLTQSEPAYCGLSTLTVILNALSVDPRQKWKGPWRWYTEEMLNCCMDLEEVKKTGITLKTFIALAQCQGLQVEGYFASESSEEHFRSAIKISCYEEETNISKENNDDESATSSQKFLAISYHRGTLKQTGSGHFSPICAFDPNSDSVLIQDTARFKYGAHWVSVPLLYKSMLELDPDTQQSRGFVLLSVKQDFDNCLPKSVLFRTKQSHCNVWEQFRKYLMQLPNNPPTLDQVMSYWSENGRDISKILTPQLSPIEKCDKEEIQHIINSLAELVKKNTKLAELHTEEARNKHNRNKCNLREIAINSAESIYITYLASLVPEEREMVMRQNLVSEWDNSHDQIVAESELVRLVMDVCEIIDQELAIQTL